MVNQCGVVGVVCLGRFLWEGQAVMAKNRVLPCCCASKTKSTFLALVPHNLLYILCTYPRLKAWL